jgi:fucose 4-O-acetylase-like acetyltransferase
MIERNRAGLLLAVIGENSFYIMGLHFVSFKLFSVILNSFGFCQNLALLKPDVKNSFTLLLGYVLFGVFVPIAFVSIIKSVWRKGLNMFQNK